MQAFEFKQNESAVSMHMSGYFSFAHNFNDLKPTVAFVGNVVWLTFQMVRQTREAIFVGRGFRVVVNSTGKSKRDMHMYLVYVQPLLIL